MAVVLLANKCGLHFVAFEMECQKVSKKNSLLKRRMVHLLGGASGQSPLNERFFAKGDDRRKAKKTVKRRWLVTVQEVYRVNVIVIDMAVLLGSCLEIVDACWACYVVHRPKTLERPVRPCKSRYL